MARRGATRWPQHAPTLSETAWVMGLVLGVLMAYHRERRWGLYLWGMKLWRRWQASMERELQALRGEEWLLQQRLARLKAHWQRVPQDWR